jgi:hypothetical protein
MAGTKQRTINTREAPRNAGVIFHRKFRGIIENTQAKSPPRTAQAHCRWIK